MQASVKRPFFEAPAPSIQIADDHLMLLPDDSHEVGPAVAVQVGHGDVDRAVALVEYLRCEARLRPILRPILKEDDLAGLVPTKGGDNEILLARAAEVSGANVGDAADIAEQR